MKGVVGNAAIEALRGLPEGHRDLQVHLDPKVKESRETEENPDHLDS